MYLMYYINDRHTHGGGLVRIEVLVGQNVAQEDCTSELVGG